jgi:hypothetical protein
MGDTQRRCKGVRKDGKLCHGWAVAGSEYCLAHSPDHAQKRMEACALGGSNHAKIVQLKRLCPPRLLLVYSKLEEALAQVHDGTLEPRQASAMAALAQAMVRVLMTGELEQRVRKLERASQGSTPDDDSDDNTVEVEG